MAKRHPNYRLVKLHRSYSVEDVADLFGIHKHTVREWVRHGLPVMNDQRPMLMLGHDLRAFLQARRIKNKRPCQPGQMYCVRCRAPKFPAGDMADYRPTTENLGTLQGICPDCGCMMNRRASLVKLEQVRGKLDVTFTKAPKQLSNSIQPLVNSALR